jgi:hypothetical protein
MPTMKLKGLARPRAEYGLSTLTVVMSLFLVSALAAAFASRHLMVEQRISTVAQDDVRAQVATEHGLERALSLLNSGAVNEACLPEARTGVRPLERWLVVDSEGALQARGSVSDPTALLCDRNAEGEWDCRCAADKAPAPQPVGTMKASAVRVELAGLPDRPGHLWVRALGCAQASAACVKTWDWRSPEASQSIARTLQVQLALLPALRQAPSNALVAVGPVDLGDGMAVVNTDASTHGVALRTASSVSGLQHGLVGPNGSLAQQRLLTHDGELADLGVEGLLRRLTGMASSEWSQQPAARVLRCESACDAHAVSAAISEGARWIQVPGHLRIDREVSWGDPEHPVLLHVAGDLDWTSPARFVGALLVKGRAQLPQTGGQARLEGTLVVGDAVRGGSATQLVHQAQVLRRLQHTVGSFLRVPGGRWREP